MHDKINIQLLSSNSFFVVVISFSAQDTAEYTGFRNCHYKAFKLGF